MIYNDFCKSKKCPFFIEWEFQPSIESRSYLCKSCTKIGQSYNVTKYPDDCKFLKEIKKKR